MIEFVCVLFGLVFMAYFLSNVFSSSLFVIVLNDGDFYVVGAFVGFVFVSNRV